MPVLYANTINQLSKIDQQTHSEGGSVVPFAAAFFPWCFYWLVFYVIQVRPRTPPPPRRSPGLTTGRKSKELHVCPIIIRAIIF